MKPEKLEQALNYIRDEFITEAAEPRNRHPLRWTGALAAMLALVLLLHTISPIWQNDTSEAPKADAPQENAFSKADEEAHTEEIFGNDLTSIAYRYAVALASPPRVTAHPDYNDYEETTAYTDAVEQWKSQQTLRQLALEDSLESLMDFFTSSTAVFLRSETGENKVYSPVNSCIALSMLAETTSGDTRQQILDVLNTQNLEALRSQVSAIWETVYCNSEEGTSILANSLWLDESVSYHQEALDNLAYYHYASSYYGNLGSEEMNKALRSWLNEQTGGLLEDSIDDLELDPASVLALASTVYLRSFWSESFNPDMNTEDTFHTPSGDITHTFMNKSELRTDYYRGEHYGAVRLSLMNGAGMWLFLPDEGTEVTSLVESGCYMDTIQSEMDDPGRQYSSVNLAIPKFDVNSSSDLVEGLKELGITSVFDQNTADFSASLGPLFPVYVGSASQAARVSIDEEGVEAASYILIDAPGSAQPTELPIVDFILDRPFLFVIERSDLPIFTGIVNEP